MDNGPTISIWVTNALPGISKVESFATVLFADGHHEIHIVEEDIHGSDPFTSPDTNFTYNSKSQLNILALRAVFDVVLPVRAGEMIVTENPVDFNTYFAGYAEFNGTVGGAAVTSYGTSEQFFFLG